MNETIQNLIRQNAMAQNPQMRSLFNQMMQGKTKEQQMQTILNAAKSNGVDINQKVFPEELIKSFGGF